MNAARIKQGIVAGARAVVVGLGKSGFSAARFLAARGVNVSVTDSREDPPERRRLAELPEQVPLFAGKLNARLLDDADMIVVSPGLATDGEFFQQARARGLTLIGDVELFAHCAQAPVAAITGTNGKSTVTTLLAAMAERAGLGVRAGGNLGEPALDLLDDKAQLYVLELSSFQLETTHSLNLAAAAVLNVSPDHMDRYRTLDDYANAKARILANADAVVLNADDPVVMRMARSGQRTLTYSLGDATRADYHLRRDVGGVALARAGQVLLPVEQMRIAGLHNAANALAALALGEILALPKAAMLDTLREFPGLPHRTQWVADVRGVHYINDSKGTNVGATLAAVAGFEGPLVVIAGGQGKGQDFSELRAAFQGKVRAVVLIGTDAAVIGKALAGACEIRYCDTMDMAVVVASRLARQGDTVLLSPACASLDMFSNYAARGDAFAASVARLES